MPRRPSKPQPPKPQPRPPGGGIKYKNAAEALLGIRYKQVSPDPDEPRFLLGEAIALIEEALKLIPKTKKKKKGAGK
jgi:hypothetical protein